MYDFLVRFLGDPANFITFILCFKDVKTTKMELSLFNLFQKLEKN